MDLLKWILKYGEGGGQDSYPEPNDQVGDELRFGASAPYHLLGCQMSKYPNGELQRK